METLKQYEIDSLEKLINVANKKNVERLGMDFFGWLLYVTEAIENYREHHPEVKDKLNSEIFQASFNWIDDNEPIIKGMEIENKDNGETFYIKYD